MAVEAHEPTVRFFKKEVRSREFSDDDIRIEFYALSQVMDEATKKALMAVLKKHRSEVAQRIERELEAIRES